MTTGTYLQSVWVPHPRSSVFHVFSVLFFVPNAGSYSSTRHRFYFGQIKLREFTVSVCSDILSPLPWRNVEIVFKSHSHLCSICCNLCCIWLHKRTDWKKWNPTFFTCVNRITSAHFPFQRLSTRLSLSASWRLNTCNLLLAAGSEGILVASFFFAQFLSFKFFMYSYQ